MDVIRTIAILLVLVCHCDSSFLPVGISIALKTISAFGVPLFVLLTGYLMLDRDYEGPYLVKYLKRNLLPLVVAFELWNIIDWILGKFIAGRSNTINFPQMVKIALFLDDTGSSAWYMPMIIGLYLGVPIISMLLKRTLSNKQYIYPFILLLLLGYFGTATPTLQQLNKAFKIDINVHNVLQMNLFGASVWGGAVWTLLLTIGYLIKKYQTYIPLPSAVVVLCFSLIAQYYLVRKEVYNNMYSMDYGSIFVVAASISIFVLILHCNNVIQKIPQCIKHSFTHISTYSFAVYMIHVWILPLYPHISLLDSLNCYLRYTILLVSCFCISFVIGRYILGIIPFIRRWLLLVK